MKYTFKMGSYFGIPVRIHFTFPLILLAFGMEAGLRRGFGEAVWAVTLVLAVFICVVLHEFGHSLQVRRYGIAVRDIILLPIGGMARAERIPDNPIQEIVVAISGPVVNFVLALIFFVIIEMRPEPIDLENDFLFNLFAINIVLGTFNLVPAFPMDGGRILRGILATRMPYVKATRYAKNVGQLIAIMFALAPFFYHELIMLPLIAVFVFYGAMTEEKMVRIKVNLDTKKVRDFIRPDLDMLSAEDTVESVSPILEDKAAFAFPVTNGRGSLTGALEAEDLRRAIEEGRHSEPLGCFTKTGFPLLEGDTPASYAYFMLRRRDFPLAGIIHDGRFVGLVDFNDLAREIT